MNRQLQNLPKASTGHIPTREAAVSRTPQSLHTTTHEALSQSTTPSSFSYSSEHQIWDTATANSLMQVHNLQGIGSWIPESSHGHPLSLQMIPTKSSLACPYHGPTLQMTWTGGQPREGSLPLTRFQAEGPSEQNAAFRRPDTGELSISRACSCHQIVEGMSYLIKVDGDD
jgi:hypothetical protein